MKPRIPASPRSRGVAAVEFAVLLPLLLLMLGAALFLGRVFWHYTVAQKAAHDAGRFLAAASVTEMRAPPVGGAAETPVASAARAIARMETAELNPGGPYPVSITVLCDGETCDGQNLPRKVMLSVKISVFDDIFPDATSDITNYDSLLLRATVTMNYVGN